MQEQELPCRRQFLRRGTERFCAFLKHCTEKRQIKLASRHKEGQTALNQRLALMRRECVETQDNVFRCVVWQLVELLLEGG